MTMMLYVNSIFAININNNNDSGWKSMTLDEPFDTNCEYRVYLKYSVDDVIYVNEVRVDLLKDGTHLAYYFNQGRHQTQFWVKDNNKKVAQCVVGDCSYDSVDVESIQKRCKWPFAEPTIKCKDTVNCFLVICKKD